MSRFKFGVVWSMVLLRVVLCPVMVLGAKAGWSGALLAAIVVIALVDDIYDGVLARRWGWDAPMLRMWDSLADTIFYLGVALTYGFASRMFCAQTGSLLRPCLLWRGHDTSST